MRALYLLLLLLPSCINYESTFKDYVSSHRKGYVANEAFYRQYLAESNHISELDKAAFKRRLDAEIALIEKAEEVLGLR